MAKNKKEKKAKPKKEKKPKAPKEKKVGGGLFSKFGIQLALIAILGVAALSFVTLGLLRDPAKDAEPPPDVKPKVSLAIDPAEVEAPATPDGAGDSDSVVSTGPAPLDGDGATPPAFSDPPPVTKGAAVAATPTPGAGTEVKVAAVGASAAKPETPAESSAKTPEEAPGETPAESAVEAAPKGPAMPKTPTPTAMPEKMPAPKAADETPKAAEKGAFPPPAESDGADVTVKPAFKDTKDAGDENKSDIPQPLWQTVDQNWDKVTIDEAADAGPEASGASWKQINVGQKDAEKPKTTALPVKPEPKPKPAETTAKSPADSKTPATKTAMGAKTPQKPVRAANRTTKPTPKKPYRKNTRKKSTRRVSTKTASVSIVNESGRPEMGDVYKTVLQGKGYRVRSTQNRTAKPGGTIIYYKPGQKQRAQVLAGQLPGRQSVAPLGWKSNSDLVIAVR